MAKKYLVWKDRNCNGISPEWIEMTGEEFYAFISKDENKKRRFIVLNNRICEDADVIIMEANEAEYRKNKGERNHEEYLDRYESQILFIPLSAPLFENADLCYEDILADDAEPTEELLLRKEKNSLLREFFDTLSCEEQELLDWLYVRNQGRKESVLAREHGVSKQTLNDRKMRIRKKLKIFLGQNGF